MELPPSVHRPETVRDVVDRVLSHPRYDRPPKSIPDRILEWFADQIGRVVGSLVGSGAGALVAWLFVLGAIALVVVLVVRFGRVGVPTRPSTRSSKVMIELTRTPTAWRDEAVVLEAEGRWKEGLRCRHRAVIAELVVRGALSDQPGRTAGEYVRDLAGALPDAAPSLAAATELFEAAWYGNAETGPDEARRFAQLDAQVLAVRSGA